MTLWLDISYLKQIGFQLDGFKETRIGKNWACRCPICGDSSKKKMKMRGSFFAADDHIMYNCFNCNASQSLSTFLKEQNFSLYERYRLDLFKEKYGKKEEALDESVFKVKLPPATRKYIPNICDGLPTIASLAEDHPVRKYLQSRCIPEEMYSKMYLAMKFVRWAKQHSDKFHNEEHDHPRLIIPWISEDGVIFGYSARSFGKEEPRYYSIKVDDSYPSFFGFDRLNQKKRVYVVEGAIDSLFVDNCVAVGTSALYRYISNDHAITYIPDRDIRNKEIMKVVEKLIETGKEVCMLPADFPGKDLNEAVMNGVTKQELKEIIDQNSYSGLSAKLKYIEWKKT